MDAQSVQDYVTLVMETYCSPIEKERLNVLYERNWTRLVTEQLKRFERSVLETKKIRESTESPTSHWTFGGALLYSVTILTTVGYGKLAPKTALGKIVTIIYAIIGVPLMLILLSAFGSLLASGAKKSYNILCCQQTDPSLQNPTVGYHKAPSSPARRVYGKHLEDTASIQITTQNSPNHMNCVKANHLHADNQEVPKRVLLATVRSNRTRGWCRQGTIRQTLAETPMPICPTHSHGTPIRNCTRNSIGSSIIGITTSDLDDADDTDDNDHVCTHDTPSRIPLIWRCPEETQAPTSHPTTVSVPAILVLLIFLFYIFIGAFLFSSTSGWSFLDSIYFCFITISTIGVGDILPQSSELYSQLQLFACCLYLIMGLIIVSMCFSLMQEEVTNKCRQIANSFGLARH